MKRLTAKSAGYQADNKTWILREINLEFQAGELAILTGPNGSGKTVLLRLLSGLLKPSEGKVLADSRSVDKMARTNKDRIPVGLVFQDPLVQILGQTVGEDISIGIDNLGLSKEERKKRIDEVLSWTGLTQRWDQDVRTLSGGERRRLCMASMLVLTPDFLLLDEPFSNLDYQGVKEVLRVIIRLKQEGKGLLIVTHELEKILAHADRLVLMKAGRIIADALPERVIPFLEEHGVRKPNQKLADMSWLA